MSDSTALGDRMKMHEQATRSVLPRRTYAVIRVDIRAAHAYLRGARRPFDYDFMDDMDATAVALCREVSGAVLGFVQSDEISVLVTDFGSADTQPWFGGVVQKIASIAAAAATLALNVRRPPVNGHGAVFDGRVFTLPDASEAANAFIWRQRDAIRNSITMAAQAFFSHRQLQGVNGEQKRAMLWNVGVDWDEYPDGAKRGRVIVKRSGEREVTYTDRRTGQECTAMALRTWWEVQPAPHFTAEPGGWLAEQIPPMPSLHGGARAGEDAEAPGLPLVDGAT